MTKKIQSLAALTMCITSTGFANRDNIETGMSEDPKVRQTSHYYAVPHAHEQGTLNDILADVTNAVRSRRLTEADAEKDAYRRLSAEEGRLCLLKQALTNRGEQVSREIAGVAAERALYNSVCQEGAKRRKNAVQQRREERRKARVEKQNQAKKRELEGRYENVCQESAKRRRLEKSARANVVKRNEDNRILLSMR